MKLIIAGGRNIVNFHTVNRGIALGLEHLGITLPSEVVSGGARGVDALGEKWAVANRILVKRFPADWARYGPAAGPRRNAEMADYADAAIVIWDGTSRGSANMLAQMVRREKRWFELVLP